MCKDQYEHKYYTKSKKWMWGYASQSIEHFEPIWIKNLFNHLGHKRLSSKKECDETDFIINSKLFW